MIPDIRNWLKTVWNKELTLKNLGLQHDKSSDFATTPWQVGRNWYIIYRILSAVYILIWCVLSAILSKWYSRPENRIKYFIYFSHWNIMLMAVMSTIQLCLTVIYMYKKKEGCYTPLNADEVSSTDSLGVIHKAFWLLYTMCADGALVLTTIFWLFLFKGGWPSIVTIHLHIFNTIYIISDLILSNVPLRLVHCLYGGLYGFTYTIFVCIYQHSGGTNALDEPYVYWILDWRYPGRALLFSILGLLVCMPAHCLLFSVYKLRAYFSNNCSSDDLSEPLIETM